MTHGSLVLALSDRGKASLVLKARVKEARHKLTIDNEAGDAMNFTFYRYISSHLIQCPLQFP